jgi:hypothetical protein
MGPNAVVLALVLAQTPAPADNGYPPGLFEHSPVIDEHARPMPHGETGHVKHHSEGSCHHYSDWRYDYPQPC